MRNALVRAVRTYAQVFVGLLLAGWVDFANTDQFLTLTKTAALAAVPSALAFIHNALEDNSSLNLGPKG